MVLTNSVPDFNDNLSGSIVERFEKIVDRFPASTALRTKGRELTYLELDNSANCVARSILDRGIKGGVVALMFHDDLLSISGIVGVLKTASAYLFLNPGFPQHRLASILKDASPGLILAEPKYLEMLNGIADCPVQDLSALDFLIQTERPCIPVSIDSPAYIIYTSGSTGEPKGILHTHRMVLHDHEYVTRDADVSAVDNFGVLAALSFVASRAGLYGSLLNGAALCMYDVTNGDPELISAWLDDERISILYTTPSLFKNIFSAAAAGHIFKHLRILHLAGDKVLTDHVELFRAHCTKDSFLIVVYGQTETGRVARFPVHHDTKWKGSVVPIGYPISNKEVLILGEDGQLVPDGESGEIVVRSSAIPSAYFSKRDTTTQKFFTDPDEPSLHLYFTGDVGKRNADGILEYLGRQDTQVKINGLRIEVGEVETAILRQEGVRSVAVVARPLGVDLQKPRLIAYIVSDPLSELNADKLREQLPQVLPAYMIPSRFIFVPSIPLSAHGKVDVRSLPEPNSLNAFSPVDLPSNETEKRILMVWKKIFNLEKISISDNFFDLGGDSLMAMNLLLSIEKEFSRKVPMAIISKASTVSQQAEILRSEKLTEYASVLIPIQTSGNKNPLYCIGGKGGLPIRFNHLLKYISSDQPVYFFRSRGFEPGELVEDTIESIAADYLREVKKVQPFGPYNLFGESSGGLVAYEMAQQLYEQGQETAFLGMLDTYISSRAHVKKNPLAGWFTVLRKHLQTLASGGFGGVQVYAKYYLELGKFKFHQFQVWINEKRNQVRFGNMPDVFSRVDEANIAAVKAYNPRPYPGSIILFRALRQAQFDGLSLDNGWTEIGVGEFVVHPVDCYHGNILFEPFVQQVAEKLKQCLDNV